MITMQDMEKQTREMLEVMCTTVNENGGEAGVRDVAQALYNAGYRKQNEWISVDERLPPKYEKVLVFDRGVIDTSWIGSQGVWYDHSMYSVTHWMPLPEAPKMKGETNDT